MPHISNPLCVYNLEPYIDDASASVPDTLTQHTSPYEATLRFGERLLHSPHSTIQNLFCLGAFLIKEGVSHTAYLIHTQKVTDTIGFTSHLLHLTDIVGVPPSSVARMERYRVTFMFADDMANTIHLSPDMVRCYSLIQYCKVAEYIYSKNNNDEFLEWIRPYIRKMIQQCNFQLLLEQYKLHTSTHMLYTNLLGKELSV